MDILGIILLTSLILFIIYMGERQRKYEKQCWNKGICADSGKPWRCFDTDSQGGRMYTDEEGHRCSISYSIDN